MKPPGIKKPAAHGHHHRRKGEESDDSKGMGMWTAVWLPAIVFSPGKFMLAHTIHIRWTIKKPRLRGFGYEKTPHLRGHFTFL